MLEVLVFSKRIIERVANPGVESVPRKVVEDTHVLSEGEQPIAGALPSLRAVQDVMWNKVGIIRDKKSLIQAVNTLAAWQKCLPEPTDRPTYELNNLVLTGRLVAEGVLLREESRGAHFRSDFLDHATEWEKHITFTL
jgi:L-aspartate oxidase